MKKYLMKSQEWLGYHEYRTAITIVDEDWMKSNGFLTESGRRFDDDYSYWWIPIDEDGKVKVSDIEKVSSNLFKGFVYVPHGEDDIDDYLDGYLWDEDEYTEE